MNNELQSKRNKLAITIITVLFLIGAGATVYLTVPSNTVSLDINPSIEIHTNRLNYVTSLNPVNEDAARVLSGYQLSNHSLKNVVNGVIERLVENGYLAQEQDNKILVSINNNTNNSNELMSRISSIIQSELQEKQIQVELLKQSMSIDKKEEAIAHDYHISAGKMALVNKLQENSSLTVDQLVKTSIKDLIKYAINHNISLNDIIQNYNEAINESNTQVAAVNNDLMAVNDSTSDINDAEKMKDMENSVTDEKGLDTSNDGIKEEGEDQQKDADVVNTSDSSTLYKHETVGKVHHEDGDTSDNKTREKKRKIYNSATSEDSNLKKDDEDKRDQDFEDQDNNENSDIENEDNSEYQMDNEDNEEIENDEADEDDSYYEDRKNEDYHHSQDEDSTYNYYDDEVDD